ncbi:MAG: DNA-protecting protein DprA [Candidatus Riflebacteria bacterium]|nr:DNA-protecting protein DprA [Candidatus Riflebacteria bacterium]
MLAAVRLSRLPGVGAAGFKDLVSAHGSPSAALAAWLAVLPQRRSSLPAVSRRKAATEEGVAAAERFLAEGGLGWHWGGPGYPGRLADLSEPPPVLFGRGALPVEPMVAVVGTRRADAAGLPLAERLGRVLAAAGRVVVSGGAAGIDAAAHRGALAAGGHTVAVLGCGVDVVFPRAHAVLFAEIAARGALLSELLPGTAPRPGFFPTRNRIVAGLAEETIVVQAPARSGALLTAEHARRAGRRVRVVVPPAAGPLWAGNQCLLEAGAEPLEPADI